MTQCEDHLKHDKQEVHEKTSANHLLQVREESGDPQGSPLGPAASTVMETESAFRNIHVLALTETKPQTLGLRKLRWLTRNSVSVRYTAHQPANTHTSRGTGIMARPSLRCSRAAPSAPPPTPDTRGRNLHAGQKPSCGANAFIMWDKNLHTG